MPFQFIILMIYSFPNDIVLGTTVAPPTPTGDYGIGLEQLVSLTREHNTSALQEYGGVSQLQTYFSLFLWCSVCLPVHNEIVTSSG